MASESLIDALGRLDPARRSLLDLSLRRGMDASEIADVLGAEVDSIVSLREGALEEVATDIGLAGAARLDAARDLLAELPADEWQAASARPQRQNGASSAATENRNGTPRNGGAPAAAPAKSAAERRRLHRLLLVTVAAGAVVIVLALTLRSGSGHRTQPAPGHGSVPAHPQASGPAPHPFVSLPGAPPGARGEIRLLERGRAVFVSVIGLPKPQGAYGVWLRNPPRHAIPIGHFAAGSAQGTLPIPPGAVRRFRTVDISQQPSSSLRDGSLTAQRGPTLLRARLR